MQADFDLPPERLDLLAKSAEGSACELPRAGAASPAGSVAALPASLSSEMALQTQRLLTGTSLYAGRGCTHQERLQLVGIDEAVVEEENARLFVGGERCAWGCVHRPR